MKILVQFRLQQGIVNYWNINQFYFDTLVLFGCITFSSVVADMVNSTYRWDGRTKLNGKPVYFATSNGEYDKLDVYLTYNLCNIAW